MATKTRMTTDQATRYLGEVLEFGASDDRADSLLNAAIQQAKRTNWGACRELLASAYRALGAKPPALDHDPGYLFYAGEHPIQYAAVEAGREMDEWLDPPNQPARQTPPPKPGPVNPPGTYETTYSRFRAAVAAAESPAATIETLDAARHALASRADRLKGRQRTELQAAYDRIVGRMLAMGWR